MQTRLIAALVMFSAPMALLARPGFGQTSQGQPGASGTSAPTGTAGTGTGSSQGASGSAPATGAAGPGVPAPAGAAGGSTVYVPPWGYPTPGYNPNAHLPSGSRPTYDTNQPSGGFDFETGTAGAGAMRGSPNAPMVSTERAGRVPSTYVVKKGDTLWNLCDQFFKSPWEWPRIWSYNPELQNPNWIYPGDQIRLRAPGSEEADGRGLIGPSTIGGRTGLRRPGVPAGTVFLRDQGYIDDEVTDIWGQVSGSPDDQLLLSEGDYAYLEVAKGHDPKIGQELTVFRPMPRQGKDERGTMVSILGTARVEQWDPSTRIARARLTESLNVIERGAKIGPVSRRFNVVPPTRNNIDAEAQIMASFYPHVLYGQNQVVFINRGARDGLVPGNRLFAISHGDGYRPTLSKASRFASSSVEYEGAGPATVRVDGARGQGEDKNYPLEVVGEVRVLSVRDHTAACLVTGARRELERGQRLVAKKGY